MQGLDLPPGGFPEAAVTAALAHWPDVEGDPALVALCLEAREEWWRGSLRGGLLGLARDSAAGDANLAEFIDHSCRWGPHAGGDPGGAEHGVWLGGMTLATSPPRRVNSSPSPLLSFFLSPPLSLLPCCPPDQIQPRVADGLRPAPMEGMQGSESRCTSTFCTRPPNPDPGSLC